MQENLTNLEEAGEGHCHGCFFATNFDAPSGVFGRSKLEFKW
jgi:hypothetical protein